MNRQATTMLPAMHSNARRAWYAFGLWLRAVIVGVGVAAAGIALLLERAGATTPVIACLIGGGALTIFAWRRGAAALRRIDGTEGMRHGPASRDLPGGAHPSAAAATVSPIGLSAAATVLE